MPYQGTTSLAWIAAALVIVTLMIFAVGVR